MVLRKWLQQLDNIPVKEYVKDRAMTKDIGHWDV